MAATGVAKKYADAPPTGIGYLVKLDVPDTGVSEISICFEMGAPPPQEAAPSVQTYQHQQPQISEETDRALGFREGVLAYLPSVSESPMTVSWRRGRVIDTVKHQVLAAGTPHIRKA